VVLSSGVKWPGRDADHSNAEIRNAWSYTSTVPIRLHSVVLRYAQGQIYLAKLHWEFNGVVPNTELFRVRVFNFRSYIYV